MNLIVAVDKNWAIGYKGKLLISIPEDMKFFRETTTGHTVVMGKNTLLSFPNSKPLKNRNNIVIALEKDFTVEGATTVYSIEEALEEIKKYDSDDVYVIGGGSIYKQLLPYCDKAYITYIDHSYSADTFFPNLDEDDNFELVEQSDPVVDNGIEIRFTTYINKAKKEIEF